ncbi:MAG TPA: hypothetical protein VJZ26_18290 [Blastocatellia bacterium]|nr:hypothetical protein [Blastocatellia bacterium]
MINITTAIHSCKIARALVPLLLVAASVGGQIQFDRPKAAKPLPNPSIIGAQRDEALTVIKQMLETREIPLDKEDCNATNGECSLITKPVIFTKGIPAKSQLRHYTDMQERDVRNWSKGRYVLRFQISPASPTTSQVGVYAKFEGMTDSVVGSEWVPFSSKGELEDMMLRCVQDRVHGGDCKDIFH